MEQAPASPPAPADGATAGRTGGLLAAGGGSSMQLDQLVRSFAVIAAAFYVIGFLTANSYLYLLGVTDFSLLRTRFILTGVMVMAPLAFALAFGVYAAIDASLFERRAEGFNRTWLWIVGDVLLPFVLYFALFAILAENDAGAALLDAALLSLVCSALVLIFLASLAVYRRTDRRPVSRLFYRGDRVVAERFNERFGIPGGLVEHLVFIIVGTLLALGYIGLFGQRFYPVLPEQLGGGRPRPVQLLIAPDAVPALNRLGIPVAADDLLTPPVELLWEGEESYVVRLPDPDRRSVIQIDQALVNGVVAGTALAPLAIPASP